MTLKFGRDAEIVPFFRGAHDPDFLVSRVFTMRILLYVVGVYIT